MKKTLLLFFLCITTYLGATPIEDLVKRVTPDIANQFEFKIKKGKKNQNYFELNQNGDKVQITGDNYISLATGYNWYLKHYAGVHYSWSNLQPKTPNILPKVNKKERKETTELQRYYLNYCTFSYSMAFWDWKRWEQELDWMAMHGINLSLATVGTDKVWFNMLTKLGYTRAEIDDFISGPAYMPWWEMNNLEGWGGPNSDNWYEFSEQLQLQIISRMKDLGIEPVFAGYAGMLPHISGEKQNLDITNPGLWCGFNRPAFLQPTDARFEEIANLYYDELTQLYGKANYYSIDPFHEGGSVEGVDLKLAGESILKAMKRVNPNSTWVIQAWQANPRPAMINTLKKGDLLVLDLYSESRPMWGPKWSSWYREEGYGKHPWIFNMLLNFGGRTGMFGKMEQVANLYAEALNHKSGKTMVGVGATMEAIENNEVMFELLFELPWLEQPVNISDWLKRYTLARYGKENSMVTRAWDVLSKTIYNAPKESTQEGTTETVFAALPNLKIDRVSCCSSTHPFYNTDSVQLAARLLLEAAPEFKGNVTFEYDLVDVVRQAIASKAYYVQKDIAKAYADKDKSLLKQKSDEFLSLILAQDELLATQPSFKLGKWVNQARRLGKNLAEQDQYEWNARTLITVWGNRESAFMLHNYAYKEWEGILRDVYYPRWRAFLTTLETALEENQEPTPIDYFKMDERWTRMTNPYNEDAVGNSIDVATKIFNTYLSK